MEGRLSPMDEHVDHLETPDCRTCAACCFSERQGYVRLSGEDHARLTPEEQERVALFRGNRCFLRMTEGRCAALVLEGGRYTCTIYERRPQLCRDYRRGGPACAYDRERRIDSGSGALPLAQAHPVPG